jgi:hypothetical protein
MEEISYRIQELTGSCLDKCPIMDNGIMVGSAKCQDCKYNNGSNIKMNTIKCKSLSFYNKIEALTKENEELREKIRVRHGLGSYNKSRD